MFSLTSSGKEVTVDQLTNKPPLKRKKNAKTLFQRALINFLTWILLLCLVNAFGVLTKQFCTCFSVRLDGTDKWKNEHAVDNPEEIASIVDM